MKKVEIKKIGNVELFLFSAFCFLFLTGATRTLNGGCSMVIGADNGSTLTSADIGPQGKQCQIPENATLIEISINADAGTPSLIVQRYRPNGATTVDLTSSALATGSAGALACSRTSAATSINGTTSCLATLQNTALSKGDWFQIKTGAIASTAKRVSISLVWTW